MMNTPPRKPPPPSGPTPIQMSATLDKCLNGQVEPTERYNIAKAFNEYRSTVPREIDGVEKSVRPWHYFLLTSSNPAAVITALDDNLSLRTITETFDGKTGEDILRQNKNIGTGLAKAIIALNKLIRKKDTAGTAFINSGAAQKVLNAANAAKSKAAANAAATAVPPAAAKRLGLPTPEEKAKINARVLSAQKAAQILGLPTPEEKAKINARVVSEANVAVETNIFKVLKTIDERLKNNQELFDEEKIKIEQAFDAEPSLKKDGYSIYHCVLRFAKHPSSLLIPILPKIKINETRSLTYNVLGITAETPLDLLKQNYRDKNMDSYEYQGAVALLHENGYPFKDGEYDRILLYIEKSLKGGYRRKSRKSKKTRKTKKTNRKTRNRRHQ